MAVNDNHYFVPDGVWKLTTESPRSEDRGRGKGITSNLSRLGQAWGQLALNKIQGQQDDNSCSQRMALNKLLNLIKKDFIMYSWFGLPVKTKWYPGFLFKVSSTESATISQTLLAPVNMPAWAAPPRKGASSQTMSSSASLRVLVPRPVKMMDLLSWSTRKTNFGQMPSPSSSLISQEMTSS